MKIGFGCKKKQTVRYYFIVEYDYYIKLHHLK